MAALLTVLGVDRELVVQEYLWSEGAVQRAWIEGALNGLGNPAAYFRRLHLPSLRRKVLDG